MPRSSKPGWPPGCSARRRTRGRTGGQQHDDHRRARSERRALTGREGGRTPRRCSSLRPTSSTLALQAAARVASTTRTPPMSCDSCRRPGQTRSWPRSTSSPRTRWQDLLQRRHSTSLRSYSADVGDRHRDGGKSPTDCDPRGPGTGDLRGIRHRSAPDGVLSQLSWAAPSALIETARTSPGCRSSRAAVRATRMTPERSFSP
jgi:hypothetical protein